MIGIIGASGKIGAEIVCELKKLAPDISLKCGYHTRPGTNGDLWEQVDVRERDSIASFMEGCRLVINAAGPSDQLSELVMQAALESKVSLIDVGHSDCYTKAGTLPDDQKIVYACGAVPGLIGFIPRRLAEEFDRIYSMTVNIGLSEMLTMTAARDLVTASELPDGKTAGKMAATERVPMIGDAVYRYQFTDAESRAIDEMLHVRSSSWYMVRDTDDYEKLFARTYKDKEEMAETLCRMYRISMTGREEYLKFVIEMEGMKDDRPKTLSAYLYGSSGSVVSGRTAASAALAVLNGAVTETKPVRLALTENWKEIMRYVEQTEAFRLFEVYPYGLSAMAEEESGEL
jgi:hypothetical protein